MWTDAARRLSRFSEAVLTAYDGQGYPVSVRVSTHAYDAATGELPVVLPEALAAVEGPANLLCHYHDEKLWNLDSAQVRGRLQRRDDAWVFVTESFTPKSRWFLVSFLKNNHTAAQRYLDKRGLDRPPVNWDAVEAVRRRARRMRGA
ncbi:hypothetical protein ACAG25_20465 [Mycobacterium sp. pV006]|uniref:hypothetical protein n=1 Tax=Mycobacterium sp. pV006 TaxID=3238983 RepID=UPI00351BC338